MLFQKKNQKQIMKAALATNAALHRSQAVIEFTPQGIIMNANDNFLTAVGYNLGEIKGKHHRLFVLDEDQESKEYRLFWQSLEYTAIFAAANLGVLISKGILFGCRHL